MTPLNNGFGMKETNISVLWRCGRAAGGDRADMVKDVTISFVEYPAPRLARNSGLAHGLDV